MTENNFNYDFKTTVEEVPVAEEIVVEPEIVEDVKVEEPIVVEPAEEPKIQTIEKPVKAEKKNSKDTVAVYSSKNISWQEVGELKVGYNILSKNDADKWLGINRKYILLATPEEVAKEFGL